MAIGVVLEQVDVTGNALARQSMLGIDDQILQDPLASAVVIDELDEIVAFGRRILRMGADIEVDPDPLRRKTLLLRPQVTTRRKR